MDHAAHLPSPIIRHLMLALAMLALLLQAACDRDAPAPAVGAVGNAPANPSVTPTAPARTSTSTPAPTATTTATPTATATPSPTPTPTPTALPAVVQGNPRHVVLAAPVAAAGAPCGLVDTLDFPIDPPDAASVAGGGDFGVYRRRYEKYHAGEDWRGPGGGSSFGAPVFSIGHGTVTYAHPDGWGRDKGVVIVRHVFADGRTFLSFYGHLDPPSVTLRAGECVARGDTVGNIGRPRTSPHLHFEIRTHMAGEPGPGYWTEDPTVAGWMPPSQTILQERLRVAPGVLWSASPFAGRSASRLPVGETPTGDVVVLEAGDLVGLAAADGRERWRMAGNATAALVDGSRLYAVNRAGEMSAYDLPIDDGQPAPTWTEVLAVRGVPALMPAVGGGVVIGDRRQLRALAPDGSPSWALDIAAEPADWRRVGDRLVVSLAGAEPSLIVVEGVGDDAWRLPVGGRLALAGARLIVYTGRQVAWINMEARTFVTLRQLSSGRAGDGDLIALADGGVLVAHSDPFDRRLIALDADGALRWERSLGRLGQAEDRFVRAGDRILLLSAPRGVPQGEANVFALDLGSGQLVRLFAEPSRLFRPGAAWGMGLSAGGLLLQTPAGGLALLDVSQALQRVAPALSQAPGAPASATP